MRLFVAVDPPAEVLDRVAEALPQVDGFRPSPRDQWHVTVAFLGEVEIATLVEKAVEVAARDASRFPLLLKGSGAFGRRGAVAWLGVAGDVAALRTLVRAVRGSLREVGILPETRTYRPHLTIGRVAREPAVVTEPLREFVSPQWTVNAVRLVASELGRNGARHQTVREWPFG